MCDKNLCLKPWKKNVDSNTKFTTYLKFEWPKHLRNYKLSGWMCDENLCLEAWKQNVDSNTLFTTYLTFEWPINLQIVRILWRHFKSFSIKAKFWWMGEENSSLEPWMWNVDWKTSPHTLHLNGLWLFKVSNWQDKFMSGIQVLIYQSKMLIQILYHTSYIWMAYEPSEFQIVRMLWR